jgi:nitronate monooxygenase/enoyl-[acyl-carrier protein] reductase II
MIGPVRTPLCELLGIEFPIVQAPFGPWTSAGLVAAVSNAGGLGSLGAAGRSAGEVLREVERIRELTARPFAVNHITRGFDEEAFAATLEAAPAVVSFALGDPGELVGRAHAVGSLFVQQVTTVEQACRSAERGVDVIIAQGSEAGGFGGAVAGLALVPQVVDAVSPIPVVAAGGIADGRGLAAALVLGAQGINVGTRFLACSEAERVSDEWKRRIVAAESEEAVKVEFWNEVFVLPEGSWESTPRALRTAFVDEWSRPGGSAAREAERIAGEVERAFEQGRLHELAPFSGQTVGLIREVLSVAEIVRSIVSDAERALRAAAPTSVSG